MARGDRRLAAVIGQWDSDPMFPNTPLGISSMSTTQSYILQLHRYDAYMTNITTVGPPTYGTDSLDGDEELVANLQPVCGYCLYGFNK
jgi:hypothetical protein